MGGVLLPSSLKVSQMFLDSASSDLTETQYSRSSGSIVPAPMRCCRIFLLVYVNEPVMKLVSLYIVSLEVSEPIDDIK